MGKILDDFMEKHGLDDGHVLAMIGDACLELFDPKFVYDMDKDKVIDDEIKEGLKRMIQEATIASIMALMGDTE